MQDVGAFDVPSRHSAPVRVLIHFRDVEAPEPFALVESLHAGAAVGNRVREVDFPGRPATARQFSGFVVASGGGAAVHQPVVHAVMRIEVPPVMAGPARIHLINSVHCSATELRDGDVTVAGFGGLLRRLNQSEQAVCP